MNDNRPISKDADLSGRTLFYVDAFGAVGDGVHDDAVAIRNCCEAAAGLQKPSAVVFTAGKVYYADSLGEHFPWTSPWSQTTVIYFEHARDIVVEGNGCRLELGPSTGCFFNLHSEKLVYHNIIVDHRIPTFISGTVEETDEEGRFLRVQIASPMDENLTDGEYVYSPLIRICTMPPPTTAVRFGGGFCPFSVSCPRETAGIAYIPAIMSRRWIPCGNWGSIRRGCGPAARRAMAGD